MKEQIACRRDNEQNVENLEGKYEKLVEEKNQEYIADRNRIRNKILTDPESLIEKIEGPDNRGFLSFIALLLFRDDTGGKKKQSPRKVKCEPPPCPAASPPSPSSPLVRSKAAIPLSLKHEEHFSFHDMPRTLGVKRGPEETKFLSIASASPAKRHRDRETGIKVTVSGNSMPEKETPQPLDLRVNKEKMAAASAAPSLDQRDNLSMDALYYNWHVRMMILGQQAMISSQHHTPASLSHLVPPHALWLHDPAAPHPTLRTQQLSLPQVNYFQRLASLTLDPIP